MSSTQPPSPAPGQGDLGPVRTAFHEMGAMRTETIFETVSGVLFTSLLWRAGLDDGRLEAKRDLKCYRRTSRDGACGHYLHGTRATSRMTAWPTIWSVEREKD
jgi:hypothetical protein